MKKFKPKDNLKNSRGCGERELGGNWYIYWTYMVNYTPAGSPNITGERDSWRELPRV